MDRVKLVGAKEIEKALFRLKDTTAKTRTRKVLRAEAEPLAARMAATAPRDTEALAESYTVGTRLTKAQGMSARREGKDDVTMYVGTANPAGQQAEFGNARHGSQPHARPAWDGMKHGILDGIMQGMWALIEKAAEQEARRQKAAARKAAREAARKG